MQRDTPETEHSFRLTFENGRIDYRLGFFPDGTLNRFGLHPIPGEVNPLDKYKSDPVPLLIASLGLRPHPEGGFFTETYRHERSAGDRSLCTAIYFLLTAENPSRMHRVASDEIWHFYKGDPLEMLQLGVNGSQRIRIGTDIASGQRPQVLVPAGTWQGVRVAPGGSYALVGATVSPGFDFADFEMGDRAALVSTHPEATDLIKELTSSP
ncbi:MAG: cupin domain-containing protein [Candidatus Eremiobacteraeota bacterium]|nr:cupin domain-containing protein [Candidatus Eremiobacteraeota bacterium]